MHLVGQAIMIRTLGMLLGMRFWKIGTPDYKSDYQDSYINGSIGNDLAFPSVDCDICVTSWGWSGLRSLPFECPEVLRGEMSTKKRRVTLFRSEHSALQQKLFDALGIQGRLFFDVPPGYRFPPVYLDIPSRPRADFLWPFSGVLVSKRIRELLMALCGDHLATFPVILRKVGKRKAKLPAPIPRSGEPEDIINEAPLLNDASEVGHYFEVVPRYASAEAPDRIVESCDACGRVKRDVVYSVGGYNPIRMPEDAWSGHRIFYLGGTLHIIVTDDVRKALQSTRPSNIQFTEVMVRG